MRNRLASLAAAALLASFAARAQTPVAPSATAPASADPAAAAPRDAPAPPRAADPTAPPEAMAAKAPAPSAHGQLDVAVAFLKALTHTARKGVASEQAWGELKDLAGDKVPVTIAGVNHLVDVGGKTGDVKLLSFSKLSTWREGKDIKGVTVGLLDFKVGADEHKAAGKMSMSASADGRWTVQSIELE